MRKYPLLPVLLLLFLFVNSKAQNYPQNYFHWPIDTPVTIVGTFGEIRDNHFHSGLDLGTEEMEGRPVSASAEGYISRIKISADGYGKALYITHPNGYVTVYGHLQKFTQPVNEYIRKIQYEKQIFELDINLKPKDFVVKQDEVIAYSGATGGAEGPHLHFEIRDEETEEPMNPFLFGLHAFDGMAPELKYIRIYPTMEAGIVNKTDTSVVYETQSVDGILMMNTTDVIQAYGYISFGVGAVDRIDNSQAVLGIYSAELYVDNQLAYTWKLDRFNFNDTKQANAHIDYESYIRDRNTIERLFRLPGNFLNIYDDTTKLGTQYFSEEASHDIKIVVKDFSGNKSQIEFPVVVYPTLNENRYQAHPTDAMLVTNAKGVAIHKSKLDVAIPANAVYQDFYYTDMEIKSPQYLSNTYRVGNWYEALNVPITVGIKPETVLADSLMAKAVIAEIQRDGTIKGRGGIWNNKFVSAQVSVFGDYAVMLDTTPPVVVKDYVPADMNSYRGAVIQFIAKDNLSKIKSWSGKVDGKWMLFEFDRKTGMLQCDVSSLIENKEHTVELTVTDERNNVTNFKIGFYF
jgi:murein DD-endopeptidase MepM/ murein hydrolase activator NlpD